MRTPQQLQTVLRRIDGRGYKAYQDIAGGYDFGDLYLFIDHVQGDPFAPASKLRVRLPMSVMEVPEAFVDKRVSRIAVQDYLARLVANRLRGSSGREGQGLGNSGRIYIDAGGQEVLERSAIKVTDQWVEARLEAGLPAAGRRILGRVAAAMLLEKLPAICRDALIGTANTGEAAQFVHCVENQEWLRGRLAELDAVAFVANGSILPRRSGISDRPMAKETAIPFQSPESLLATVELPHPPDSARPEERRLSGMLVRKGVTLIAGGGYHGKSTLLRALERGVFPHVPGDGREYVVTDPDAVKIRAEDRRRVEKVDVLGFISGLPNGQRTDAFCTEEASGSTSQAAAILQSIEAGATALLVDEDTSATNLMVRDARMQALVAKAHEPITPLIDRVGELFERHGVSTILVMGGSGDYFESAHQVILLREYRADDATADAKKTAAALPVKRQNEAPAPLEVPPGRSPDRASLDPSRGRKRIRIDAPNLSEIRFGQETIDLRAVEQLVDRSQTRAVGYAIHRLAQMVANGESLAGLLDALDREMDTEGLEVLDPYMNEDAGNREHPGNFARPRRHEIAAALNRLRSLRVRAP